MGNINFGYGIHKDRQHDYDKSDQRLASTLRGSEPGFQLCIACGSCTATCSAGEHASINFRRIQLMIHRGDIQYIRKEISACMLCGKCTLVCPRGVNTRNIILKIKNYLSDQP